MINTHNFMPIASCDSIILDNYLDKTDFTLGVQEDYCDELTDAYTKLKEMCSYNYDGMVESDYDEMLKLHYYEWLHKYDDSIS